ncbi:MAG TPA: hypothetical protein VJB37_00925 [Patescibacteria group bacterium]|nr:hypothetical protein [Patescibacteria group bacterium]
MKSNSSVIRDTVLDMGGTIEEFLPERDCFYVNVAGKRFLLERHITVTRNSYVSGRLTEYKDITYKLLVSHGWSSPKTESFYYKTYNRRQVEDQLHNLVYPIIIKNAHGSNSQGVFPFIMDGHEAQKIIRKNLPKYQSMIAQEMVFGKEYRILVLGDRVIAGLQMIHPHIVGDGRSTVRKIIQTKQNTTERRTPFDKKLLYILKKQGVKLRSVLPKNKIIYIKGNACLAEGGETKDITDDIHPEIKKMAVSLSKMVGKNLIGIDLICTDIFKYPDKKYFFILEINGNPSLDIHNHPTHGRPRNVAKKIIQFVTRLSVSLQQR